MKAKVKPAKAKRLGIAASIARGTAAPTPDPIEAAPFLPDTVTTLAVHVPAHQPRVQTMFCVWAWVHWKTPQNWVSHSDHDNEAAANTEAARVAQKFNTTVKVLKADLA